MSDWDDYFEAERRRLGLSASTDEPLMDRPAVIKYLWENAGRSLWPEMATETGLIFCDLVGIVGDIHYKQARYGDVMVVEAEAVIVERVVIHG